MHVACISEAALWPGARLILSDILPSTGCMAEKNARALVACEDRAQALSHLGHTHAMPLLRDPRDASIHDTCMFTNLR